MEVLKHLCPSELMTQSDFISTVLMFPSKTSEDFNSKIKSIQTAHTASPLQWEMLQAAITLESI